ncbi:MAG: CvpA family protein [Ruminococcaceae bacterium]|nr:CvpA family protein [Oscillospiraceae bacterium]
MGYTGYLTLGVLGFTAFSLIWGAFLGLVRGRNRSILRLLLVLASAFIPVKFKDQIVSAVMAFEFNGKSLNVIITEFISSIGTDIPESIQSILFTLVEIIVCILIFFVSFIVLSFVSWLILFPILKIIVRKGKNGHRLTGAFFGLIQGAVVAFVICAPITGLAIQVDKISQIQFQEKYIIEIPAEVGLSEYINSSTGKFYNSTGSWFFDEISTKVDDEGKKMSISDACDVVSTVAGIADTFSSISADMSAITSSTVTPQEQVNTIKKIGDSLISIGNSVNNLNEDSKVIVQDLIDGVKEMVSSQTGTLPPEVENALDSFNVQDLKLESAGAAMNGIAAYIEKTSDEFENSEPVTQEEVNSIVNGLADNVFILDIISAESESVKVVDVDLENKEMFNVAIDGSSLTEENKETLRQMFGLDTEDAE